MKDIEIYNYIDSLIINWVKNGKLAVNSNSIVRINDNFFELNLWHEIIDNQTMQIFELRDRSKIFDTVYTKGVLFSDDSYKILSNEKLWEYGF